MKMLKFVATSGALLLGLGAFGTAYAATCAVEDVYINNEASLACAGAFTDPANASLDALNGFEVADWTDGVAPDPLDGWLLGGKWNVSGDSLEFEGEGELGSGAASNYSAGNFTIDISPFAQVVIAFKQASGHAYYYFKNDGTGTFDLSWAGDVNPGNPDSDVFSNLTLFVRGEVPVPEPAALALLGLGLVGIGITRRRRQLA